MSDVFGPIALPPPLLPGLALSRAEHDRMAADRNQPGIIDALLASSRTSIVAVRDGQVPVTDGPSGSDTSLYLRDGPLADLPEGVFAILLGRVDDQVVIALSLPAELDWPGLPATGTRWAGLREVGTTLDARGVGLAVEAIGLDNWHRAHPRCPRCGATTVSSAAGHERRCTVDGSLHHPRSDPAVIMLVVDPGDRVLLGRQAVWPPRRYSVLAGFVEPGESLEAAVARETREEAGVTVGAMRYLGSQPWPFPASLMVAFEALATTTDIHVDGVEITEADWFSRDQLATAIAAGTVVLPPRLSIARQMVEHWAGSRLGGDEAWR